jgi:hypothetical protein
LKLAAAQSTAEQRSPDCLGQLSGDTRNDRPPPN